MEFLGQQAFVHQHKAFAADNPDRGYLDDQILEGSVNQDLDKLFFVGIVVVAFEVVAFKVISRQYCSPNLNILDPVVNR